MKDNWLAAYLYYNEPWEEFLTEAVKPFAEEMLNLGLADRFFFIRYWEKGPHIRLRFQGDPEVLYNEIKPAIDHIFTSYYRKRPSKREEPAWPDHVPAEYHWFPNNTIQYIPYEPETERYGGAEAMQLAERQFESSSLAIFDIIEQSEGWEYNRAMGAAIQLHLAFAHALGMNMEEARGFYAHTFHTWLPRAYSNLFDQSMPAEEIAKRKERTLNAFEVTYEKQKEGLIPFHRQMWEALQDGSEFEQEWLNRWIGDMRLVDKKLRAIQDAGKLVIPYPEFYREITGNIPVKSKERWAIYDSYVHMTNNRLGIRNQDEGYLGYIMKRCLEEM